MMLLGVLLALLACACGYSASPAPSTAPPVPWPVKHPDSSLFRFAVYGDTRDGHDIHRDIVKAVESTKPELVLQTGDLVSDSSVEAQWNIFEEITRSMRAAAPYYPARGNHDNQGGTYFDGYMPKEGVHREGFYYSFDKGRIHFVAIDTEDELIEKSRQYLWLDADMKKAKEDGKFIIPYYHKAIWSIGPHSVQGDVLALRPVLHDLFRKNGVRLAFQGHDHIYYRSIRDGVVYVVTGGGGAPLYETRHPELMIPGDVGETIHHFCVADVFEERVDVTVYRHDLSQLDFFSVAIPARPDASAAPAAANP